MPGSGRGGGAGAPGGAGSRSSLRPAGNRCQPPSTAGTTVRLTVRRHCRWELARAGQTQAAGCPPSFPFFPVLGDLGDVGGVTG